MTRYAKTMSQALAEMQETKKITKRERDELENDNQHGELALRLAQSFGTPQEVKKIKDINKRHMQKGSIDHKDQKERDAISNKYYKMAEDNKYRDDIQSQTTHENDLTHSKEETQPEWGTDESTLKAKKMTPGELDEDAKMGKQSDDNLRDMLKKMRSQNQKMPSIQYMIKRIEKEMKKRGLKEDIELDEKYDLYHKSFSDAMQHAYDYAKKKMGITVDPKEIDSKVATGPKKPSEGKTNTYRLKGKGGNLQIQVYNKGGSKPFE